jgi:2-iminobutanoate/2-iminopropanoate deaminase
MAAKVGPLLCTSAIYGADPETGKMSGTVEEEVQNTFRNLRVVLEKAGGTPADLAQLRIRLRERSYGEHINAPWLEMFPNEDDRLARLTVVEAGLPQSIQMDAIAYIEG